MPLCRRFAQCAAVTSGDVGVGGRLTDNQKDRNNNHGTSCGQALIFIDAYLNDTTSLTDHSKILRSYIEKGYTYWTGFKWKGTNWHDTTTTLLKRGVNCLLESTKWLSTRY